MSEYLELKEIGSHKYAKTTSTDFKPQQFLDLWGDEMFNQDATKELSKLYLKMHSINTKLKTLDLEQEIFVQDEKEYLLARNELELEMLDVIKHIGEASGRL